jgi:hypothetical protein
MSVGFRLPSRYEDLDEAFRGRLKPEHDLLAAVKTAFAAMKVSGGIRFLPVFGKSGSGKSCAAFELSTHLPETLVVPFPREAVEDSTAFSRFMDVEMPLLPAAKPLILVIDQYEEAASTRENIPSQFVERLSLLDRSAQARRPMLFLWLTTSQDFQRLLVQATTRNRRILVREDFSLSGPPREDWPGIIQETFEFHNVGKPLADLGVLVDELKEVARTEATLGLAIERVGLKVAEKEPSLQDISKYQVIMLWPVTDGTRIATVGSFTSVREGYRLDWNTWYRELSAEDQAQLPLQAFNRARLYFDVRLVPIAAADLHPLCGDLDDEDFQLQPSYLKRFEKSHFYSIVKGTWNAEKFSRLRERESERAEEARVWYADVTETPTALGKRIAKILRALDIQAEHEQPIESPHGTVRADVLAERPGATQDRVIIELKAYSPENTMPSSIRDAVRTTLRRHAHLAGFLPRQ